MECTRADLQELAEKFGLVQGFNSDGEVIVKIRGTDIIVANYGRMSDYEGSEVSDQD